MWWFYSGEWCCATFRGFCENRLAGPMFIRIRRIPDAGPAPVFTWEFRAAPAGARVTSDQGVVATSGFQAIDYCPFCGVVLQRFYRSRLQQMAEQFGPEGPDVVV